MKKANSEVKSSPKKQPAKPKKPTKQRTTRTAAFASILKERKPLTIEELSAKMLKAYPSTAKQCQLKTGQYIALLKDCGCLQEKDNKITLKKC